MITPTPQEQLKQVLRLLSYAEVRAIVVAWAQDAARGRGASPALPWNPIAETFVAVTRARDEGLVQGSEEFALRAIDLLRESSLTALEPAIRRGGPWPFDTTIGRGQIGGTEGLDELFDEAGRIAVWHRDGDLRMLRVAIQIFEQTRSRGDSVPA